MSFPCQVGLVVAQVEEEEECPDERSQLSDHLSDHLAVDSAAHFPPCNYTYPDLSKKSIVAWSKAIETSHVV
jgi:hypothetical protein